MLHLLFLQGGLIACCVVEVVTAIIPTFSPTFSSSDIPIFVMFFITCFVLLETELFTYIAFTRT